MYQYVSSMPDYKDPDTAAAENLIIASRLLQDAGFADEAESLAGRARALFEGVPYDKKRQARVLGCASCSPEGILTCRPKCQEEIYQVASHPYDDGGEAEKAKRSAAESVFLKAVSRCARDMGLGWLASAQLSSALTGKPVRPVQKSLAKAVASLYGAAAAADRAGWSGPAARLFQDSVRRSHVLDEELGSWRMREDAGYLSETRKVAADEGTPAHDGGWIMWFPTDVLASLAAGIGNYRDIPMPGDDILQSIRQAMPLMRGAWYPLDREWDRYGVSERIAETATLEASRATGIPMEDLEGASSDVANNIDTALCRAMHAKRLADAYRIFLEAARRDEDTERLFLKTGFLSPDCPCLPEGPAPYGNIAAAVLESGWRGYATYAVRGERCTDGPRTAAFREAALETSRAGIREWFASDEAKELFAPLPGAYRNCPKPEEDAGKEEAAT